MAITLFIKSLVKGRIGASGCGRGICLWDSTSSKMKRSVAKGKRLLFPLTRFLKSHWKNQSVPKVESMSGRRTQPETGVLFFFAS